MALDQAMNANDKKNNHDGGDKEGTENKDGSCVFVNTHPSTWNILFIFLVVDLLSIGQKTQRQVTSYVQWSVCTPFFFVPGVICPMGGLLTFWMCPKCAVSRSHRLMDGGIR